MLYLFGSTDAMIPYAAPYARIICLGLSIFGSDNPLFYEFATRYIRIYMAVLFLNALQPITSTFCTAIGKANLGFWMAVIRQGFLMIPLLLTLPKFLELDGVLLAGPISDGIAAIIVIFIGMREVKQLKQMQGTISKGNLTYHFKKKEEIMESLVLESPKNNLPSTAATLKELDIIFIDMQKTLQEHSYYFLHHAQLSTLSPKIREVQNYAYSEMVNTFQQAFHTLRTADLLRKEEFEHEYEHVTNMLLMSCIYWTPFAKLQKSVGINTDFRTQAWSTIYHLLTEKGRHELADIIQIF